MTIKVLLGLICLAAGWIAVLAGTMAWSNAAPAAFVPFPSAEFLAALPEHVAIFLVKLPGMCNGRGYFHSVLEMCAPSVVE